MTYKFSYNFVVTHNTEDPEMGGFFAYFDEVNPNDTRGYGLTELEAIACLCAVQAEQEGEDWPRSGRSFV